MKLTQRNTHKRVFFQKDRMILRRKGLAIALLSSSLSLLTFAPAQANPSSSGNNTAQRNAPVQFVPPPLPDRGRPGRPGGGASRGSCDVAAQRPLTALVPNDSNVVEESTAQPDSTESTDASVFSLTTEARPTFWFYTPYPVSETPMELVIQDDQNNTLYQGSVTGEQDESGVIGVALPELATGLTPGTLYHWYFMAYCDESGPAFVEGWIERMPVGAALRSALQDATPREQAVIYAQNGIWQETITLLGEQYRGQKDNEELLADWQSLLESAGLAAIAEEPLIDCCTL